MLGRYEDDPKGVYIDLLCSRNTMLKMGQVLLRSVEEHSLAVGGDRVRLSAIDDIRLVRWYESQGYSVKNTIHLPNGKIKVYEMIKKL